MKHESATHDETKFIESIDEALAAIPTKAEIDEFFFNGTPPRWVNFGLEYRYKVKKLAEAGLAVSETGAIMTASDFRLMTEAEKFGCYASAMRAAYATRSAIAESFPKSPAASTNRPENGEASKNGLRQSSDKNERFEKWMDSYSPDWRQYFSPGDIAPLHNAFMAGCSTPSATLTPEVERLAWDTIKEFGCHVPERTDVKLAKALLLQPRYVHSSEAKNG